MTSWWWIVFGADKEFSIWDFISATSYYEASGQTRFAPTMAKAVVRLYYARTTSGFTANTNPEAVINFWAGFCKSAATRVNTHLFEPATVGTPSEMSIIGESFKDPGNLSEGWKFDEPISWGNLSVLLEKNDNGYALRVHKENSQAMFIKHGSERDWDNKDTFFVPSGCLWKKADSPNDPGWQATECPQVRRIE